MIKWDKIISLILNTIYFTTFICQFYQFSEQNKRATYDY